MNSIYKANVSKRVPQKNIKNDKILIPWVTAEIVLKISVKNRLFENFIKTKDSNLLGSYNVYKNQLNKEPRNAQEAFRTTIFYDATTTSEDTLRRKVKKKRSAALHVENLRNNIKRE